MSPSPLSLIVGASVPDKRTEKLLMAGEEPDYPKGHIYVRACAVPPHSEVPAGNVCATYLEACHRLGVVANSACATELLHIARKNQDLPYHKTHGRSREVRAGAPRSSARPASRTWGRTLTRISHGASPAATTDQNDRKSWLSLSATSTLTAAEP